MRRKWFAALAALLLLLTLAGCRKASQSPETTAPEESAQTEPSIPYLIVMETLPQTAEESSDTTAQSARTTSVKQNAEQSQDAPVQTSSSQTTPAETTPQQTESGKETTAPQPDAETTPPETTAPQPEAETTPPETTAPQPEAETPPPETAAPQPDAETPPSGSVELGTGGLPLAPG